MVKALLSTFVQNDNVMSWKQRWPHVSEEREKKSYLCNSGGGASRGQKQSNDLFETKQSLQSSVLFCFASSMALPSCLKTGVPMSPATGFSLSGSLMKSDCGFAVPIKLQSIRKGDRERLRIQAVFSFPPAFLTRNGRAEKQKQLKQELLEAIEPLERGATATPDDQLRIDQLARKVEAVNPTKEPLKSDLINGKWELIYTTSASILQAKKPRFLRSITNYQSINVDTLKVQNMETWPFYNSVTGDIKPLNSKKVAVKLQVFKILGLIPIKAPDTARGELEITYVDEELRLSRGDKGNLFILKMFDPSYRIPL